MADPVLFDAGGVRVTRSLASFGQESFPIANIGSIRIRAASQGAPKALLVLGVLGTVGELINPARTGGAVVVGLIVIAVALVWSRRRPGWLMIGMGSGDRPALRSSDLKMLGAIKTAIEEAIAQRGAA